MTTECGVFGMSRFAVDVGTIGFGASAIYDFGFHFDLASAVQSACAIQRRLSEGPIEIFKNGGLHGLCFKEIFAEAEKKPWFKDTLFIITADHAAVHYRPEYTNDIGTYKIPLILYHPTYKFPAVDTSMVAQQTDILPTILDFLNIPQNDRNYLGSSLFAPGDKVAVNFNDGHYLLFAKDYFMRWAPGQSEPQMFAMAES